MSEENIIVRWESDDGWREGVLCCLYGSHGITTDAREMANEIRRGTFGGAVIWDRHRNERCIIPLGAVRLIPPRCQKCDGEGVVYRALSDAGPLCDKCECVK